MLFDLLRFVDSTGSGFNPIHVPESADHFIAKMRKRLPLLPVYGRDVDGKNGSTAEAMETPFNLILLRLFSCPKVMEEYRKNVGGHVMSEDELQRDGVTDTITSLRCPLDTPIAPTEVSCVVIFSRRPRTWGSKA